MSTRKGDRLAGVRLLVVEDNATLQQLLRKLLESQGATVVAAGTGREALELAQTQTFDFVLTDLGLPDIHGEVVITHIRAMSQGRTPVAVLSGADHGRLTHALQVGAERVFTKPVEWDNLLCYLTRRTAGMALPLPAPSRRR